MFEPLSPFALFLHWALVVLVLGAEFYRNKGRRFDYLTLFSAAYLLNYAVVPLVYDAAGYTVLAQQVRGLKQPPSFELDSAAVDIFLGYLMFFGGYFVGRDVLRLNKSPILVSKDATRIAFALGIAGVASFFLYALAYGGVLGLIKLAPLLRAGKKIAHTPLVSASKFMGLSAFGLWAAASATFERLGPIRLAQFAGFAVVAMLAAMATAGRTQALVYFVPVLMLWSARGQTKIPVLTSILMLVALVLWVDWARAISADLAGFQANWTSHGGVGLHFLQDFYPTYASVPAALKQFDATGRIFGFADFGTALEHLVPQHLLGTHLMIESSGTLNTFLIGSNHDTRPPGLIAWSIYSLGAGWFLLWPLAYGVVAGMLQSRFAPDDVRNPFAFCVYIGIGAFSSYTLVFDTDPTVYLNGLVWLISGIVLTELYVRRRARRTAGRRTPPPQLATAQTKSPAF